MQKLAHEIAWNAVESMEKGNVRIVIRGSRFSHVETDENTIKFYAKHLSFMKGNWNRGPTWGFDIEKKLYLTSDHSTKISFWAPEEKLEETEKRILEFIAKIMAGVKPVPRFSLEDFSQRRE